MKRSRTRVASFYAQLLMAMMGAGTAWADAQLVNFNAADRVPGVYEIIFKKPSELRLLPRRGLKNNSIELSATYEARARCTAQSSIGAIAQEPSLTRCYDFLASGHSSSVSRRLCPAG
jgi:hypothetical protein